MPCGELVKKRPNKIIGVPIATIRYADGTVLVAENAQELKNHGLE